MEQKQDKINLNRHMDVGEVYTATFVFIRQNAGELFKCLFFLGGPVAFAGGVLLTVFFSNIINLGETIQTSPIHDPGREDGWWYTALVYGGFYLLTYTVISIVGAEFVYLYQKNPGNVVKFEQVRERFFRDFFRLLLAKIIMWPLIALSSLFVVIPGFITLSYLSGTEMIMLETKAGPFKAISQSGKMMNKYFGGTMVLIMGFVVLHFVVSLLLSIPPNMMENAGWITSTGGSGAMEKFIIAMRALSNIASHLLFLLPAIALAIRYYTVREEDQGETILTKVRAIGGNQSPYESYGVDDEF